MKADINTPLSFNAEVLKRFYLENVRKNEYENIKKDY